MAEHVERFASLNPLFQKGRFRFFVARLCVEGGFVRIDLSLALYERCRRLIVEPPQKPGAITKKVPVVQETRASQGAAKLRIRLRAWQLNATG